jgi:glutathione S-transferase
VREVVTLVDDVIAGFGFYAMNATELFKMKFEQSEATAKMAKKKMEDKIGLLVDGAREKVGKGKWIAGTDEPSLADCAVLAFVEFARSLYGLDICAKYEVLGMWRRMWEGRKAVVETEEMKAPEQLAMAGSIWNV